ncbi:MAG: alanine racemase [Calditrichia bacterium]
MQIIRPTLLLNETIVHRNLLKMAGKAAGCNLRFRPHFKTHQSIEIGKMFRKAGVSAITVSSLKMAAAFAADNWQDIIVAFPVNILEMEEINHLAQRVKLGLLVEAADTVEYLQIHLKHPVQIWIKVDCGYHRTGVSWREQDRIVELAGQMMKSEKMHFRGLLTHAGQSYQCRSRSEVVEVHKQTLQRMISVKKRMAEKGFLNVEVSVGDTPTCSVVEDFSGVQEIRPGNFIFYDLTQRQIGSCSSEDIAVALACPVAAVHPERNEVLIYGGAIHLSKEFLVLENGQKIYGEVCLLREDGWSAPLPETVLTSLSQEHGIIRTTPEQLKYFPPGRLIAVLPVHACLCANLMREYTTLQGRLIRTIHR